MESLTKSQVVDLFERRRRAWLAEDVQAYLDLWSEDMIIHLPGYPEPLRGRAAYAQMVTDSFGRMRPVSWEFHRLAIDEDHVLSEWTISGQARATSRPVSWRGMAICRIERGLIREWREYWDPAALRGVVPE